MTNKNLSRRALLATAGMAATWAGLLSTPAWADPSSTQLQAQLDQARADLESMGDQLATLQNALSTMSEALEATRSQVTETQEKIDATSAELAQKRGVLSDRMRSAYKGGSETALDVILGSTSVEDLVSRVYYLDKVNDSDANAIDEVRSLTEQLQQQMSDLENQQSEQEAQAAEAQQNLSSYESEVERAQSYYNSLDSQVQEALAKEAAHTVRDLEHDGVAFSRTEDGRIAQRRFGGHTSDFGKAPVKRAAYAADRVGHQILFALWQQCVAQGVAFAEEWYVTDLVQRRSYGQRRCGRLRRRHRHDPCHRRAQRAHGDRRCRTPVPYDVEFPRSHWRWHGIGLAGGS